MGEVPNDEYLDGLLEKYEADEDHDFIMALCDSMTASDRAAMVDWLASCLVFKEIMPMAEREKFRKWLSAKKPVEQICADAGDLHTVYRAFKSETESDPGNRDRLGEASVKYATRNLDNADYWKRVGKAFKAGSVTGETYGDKDTGSRTIDFNDCDYVIPGTEIKLTRVSIRQNWRKNGTPSKPVTSIDYADAKGNWGEANFGRYANFYGDSDEEIAGGIVKDIVDSAKDYLSYWYEEE